MLHCAVTWSSGRVLPPSVNLNKTSENKENEKKKSASLPLSIPLCSCVSRAAADFGVVAIKADTGSSEAPGQKGAPAAAAGHCCFCCRGRLGGQWLMRPHRWRQRESEREAPLLAEPSSSGPRLQECQHVTNDCEMSLVTRFLKTLVSLSAPSEKRGFHCSLVVKSCRKTGG